MNPKFSDVVSPSLFDLDDEPFDEDEYELSRLQKQIDDDNIQQINDYNESKHLIMAICKDMKDKNPDIGNELNKLIGELQTNSDIVDKIQKGGARDGVRLAQLEHNVASIQSTYTRAEIRERLEKFTRVTVEELFQLPKGMWVRYFIKSDTGGRGLYRTGGFVIHHDPEKRYVTLIAHHNDKTPQKQSYTWNIQIETVHSIYAMTKNVRKYRLTQNDLKYHLPKGVSNMLHKYMEYDSENYERLKENDQNMVIVVYDMADHAILTPIRKQTNTTLLKSIGVTKKDVMYQIKQGIPAQLENPLQGIYLVATINKHMIPKLKKLKSRIKV